MVDIYFVASYILALYFLGLYLLFLYENFVDIIKSSALCGFCVNVKNVNMEPKEHFRMTL